MKKNFNPYQEIGVEETVRLVIYDDSTKAFIKKEIIEKLKTVEINFNKDSNVNKLKYKYQINIENGKWKDIKKYSYVFRTNIKSNSKTFSFSSTDIEDTFHLESLDNQQINYFFVNLLKSYYYFLFSSPNTFKVKAVKSYLSALSMNLVRSNNTIAHCYTQMTLMTDYIEKAISVKESLVTKQIANVWISEAIEKYKFNQEHMVGFKTGGLVTKGHITSLYDRHDAYSFYQEALKLGESFIDNFLAVDALSTYYPDITEDNQTYEILHGYGNKAIGKVSSERITNICFSTDTKYFQMFVTSWANASFYFEKLILNFGVVTNSKDEYENCVENYQIVVKSIAKLLNVEVPDNYRFFWIKSTVINKTVYACARFYLARYLLDNYDSNVFVSDIDQLVVGDFEKYLKLFEDKKYSVYQPITSGFFSMLPGRSHLAGNIYIHNDAIGKQYCQILTDYVGMGVEEKFSWILDQNATRYASEYIKIGNLDDYGQRTLRQFPDLKRKLRK